MALQQSGGVVTALRRLRGQLRAETDRSAALLAGVVQSSTLVDHTVTEQRAVSGGLGHGATLLTNLRRREGTDKLLIALGSLFFCSVVLYIVSSRLRLHLLLGYFW